ncbi:hypothetical protein CMO89_04320 [Candidatus Woesearchaeota archaeon]|nr:hypothetical protein [Candidatus Woesearchaeota archaeon]
MLKTPVFYKRVNRVTRSIYKGFMAGRGIASKPNACIFTVTKKCNGKCLMCNVWKDKAEDDLGIKDIEKIFSDPLLDSIESLHLYGGEPTLRKDLVGIVKIALKKCKKLKTIGFSTNCVAYKPALEKIKGILEILPQDFEKLNVRLSLDGLEGVHNKVRGLPFVFDNAMLMLEELKKIQKSNSKLGVSIGCVIQPANVHQLDKIYEFIKSNKLEYAFNHLIINPSSFFSNTKNKELTFTDSQIKKITAFLKRISGEQIYEELYTNDIINMYWGKRRSKSRGCVFGYSTIFIENNGDVFMCMNNKSAKLGNALETDLSRIWFSKKADAIRKDIKSYCGTCRSDCGKNWYDIVRYILKKKIGLLK